MGDDVWLTERFEVHRGRLKSVASRMLGSPTEADDAVQEAWLRFSRSDTSGVENLGSWLTTVVSRVCLNMLQRRRTRSELNLDPEGSQSKVETLDDPDPEGEALLADSVGLALLIVLDGLEPPERVAFVLHDMFGVSFDEIAPIVGRSEPATRQLASRARRRVRGQPAPDREDRVRQATLVEAFLAASRSGNFEALLAVLDPDVVLRADTTAVDLGAEPETHGATAVAAFCRRARGALGALIDGRPGAVWMPGGEPRVVFSFTARDEKIVAIDLIADKDRVREIELLVTETQSEN